MMIDLPDEAATAALGEDIAAVLAQGDVVALRGDLGAGKTTLARALLRALAADPALEVPSPTFTLVQAYATPRLAVAHFDLYRIADASELAELGLDEAAAEGAVLVEWPERAGDRLPRERVDLTLAIAGSGRRVAMDGAGTLPERVRRSVAARAFLNSSGWSGSRRVPIAGDASTRRYARVTDAAGRTAILMDWPPAGQLPPDDPRARFRARSSSAFIAVDAALAAAGLSVPEIYAADSGAGFALMEDFGQEPLTVEGAPDPLRFGVAIDALAAIHGAPRPLEVPLPGGGTHRLPHFGGDALVPEVAVFADAYMPFVSGVPLSASERDELMAIWRTLGGRLATAEQSWVLFDVQTPNLFWLRAREGIRRVGFIDFQDMFVGPAAYDVASFLGDARIDVRPAVADELAARYVAVRRAVAAGFDESAFREQLAICTALRTLKNMGAFARFASAGNANYVKYLPRLSGYLSRALCAPVLTPFALWYERRFPTEAGTA